MISKGTWRRKFDKELPEELGIASVISFVRRRGIQWLGHVTQRSEKDISRVVVNWKPIENRSRGRHRKWWFYTLEEHSDKIRVQERKKLVEYREKWKEIVIATKTFREYCKCHNNNKKIIYFVCDCIYRNNHTCHLNSFFDTPLHLPSLSLSHCLQVLTSLRCNVLFSYSIYIRLVPILHQYFRISCWKINKIVLLFQTNANWQLYSLFVHNRNVSHIGVIV